MIISPNQFFYRELGLPYPLFNVNRMCCPVKSTIEPPPCFHSEVDPFFLQGPSAKSISTSTDFNKDLIGSFSSNNEHIYSQFSLQCDAEALSFHKISVQRSANNPLPNKVRNCDTLWENVKKIMKMSKKRHLLRKFYFQNPCIESYILMHFPNLEMSFLTWNFLKFGKEWRDFPMV